MTGDGCQIKEGNIRQSEFGVRKSEE